MNTKTRIKPSIVAQLLSSQIHTAQVADYIGINTYTLRYRWLKDNENQTCPPALIDGISKVLGINKAKITEEFHPVQTTSTIN